MMVFVDDGLTGFEDGLTGFEADAGFAADFGFGATLAGGAGFGCVGEWAFVAAVFEGLTALFATPVFEGSS